MKVVPVLLLFAACSAVASPQDEVFLDAREAFQRGDIGRLNQRAQQLEEDYPLRPYVQYWQLRSRLADAPPEDIRQFLDLNNASLLADRLRGDWLRQMGRSGEWDDYLREFADLSASDVELNCYAAQGRLAQGEAGVLSQMRPLWFSAQMLPEGCLPLFRSMFERQILSTGDAWTRIRMALESGSLSAAKLLFAYLPAAQRPDAKSLDTAARRPQRYLENKSLPLATRQNREIAILALYRSAETGPRLAADRLESLSARLSDEEQSYAWAQIATVAARNLHPDALAWFKKAAPGLSDRQLTWRARAGLRAGDWSDVFATISAMSPAERNYPQWRYWKARALSALNRQQEANLLLAPLANEFNFYGQLASDELGASVSSAPQTYRAENAEVEAIGKNPGLRRALTLYRVGLRYEGALEWQWTIRSFDDKQLLAAAELAVRNDWYERAIDTAERTTILHDFGLRYPTPFRTVVQDYSQQLGLDEAWVYGLVRQESRFVHTAKSSAGASGLMQLMPSTARWVARRLGLKTHHTTLTETVDTNISLGTFYLKQVLDSVDNHLVLASAGYNAGPRRAREWTASRPLEGAIYIETIPFAETREYVKRVMNNTLFYARLFRQPGPSLRDRLGVVPAKSLPKD